MISQQYLVLHGYNSMQAFYDETTAFYISAKYPQVRNNLLAMGKQQRKDYFFKILKLYPDKLTFLEFVMAFI